MQEPTCTGIRIRGYRDAEIILHAVRLDILPMIHRRLDDDDRIALRPGHVYVWEERSNNPLEHSSLDAIQRFTDGRSWGPSKAREDFLIYYEKEGTNTKTAMLHRNSGLGNHRLIKQTYSAFVDGPRSTRKWHINAYYTQETHDELRTIDDISALRDVRVPSGLYLCARSNTQRRTARAVAAHSAFISADPGGDSSDSSLESVSSPPSPVFDDTPIRLSITSSHSPPSDHNRIVASLVNHHDIPPPRRLAPLEYLQNIPPVAREPADDRALRSFRYKSVL